MGHRLTARLDPDHSSLSRNTGRARSPADQAPDVPLWNLTRGWIPTHLKRMALGVARGALPCTLRPCSNNGWAPASSSERASWPPQEVVPRHACVLVGGRISGLCATLSPPGPRATRWHGTAQGGGPGPTHAEKETASHISTRRGSARRARTHAHAMPRAASLAALAASASLAAPQAGAASAIERPGAAAALRYARQDAPRTPLSRTCRQARAPWAPPRAHAPTKRPLPAQFPTLPSLFSPDSLHARAPFRRPSSWSRSANSFGVVCCVVRPSRTTLKRRDPARFVRSTRLAISGGAGFPPLSSSIASATRGPLKGSLFADTSPPPPPARCGGTAPMGRRGREHASAGRRHSPRGSVWRPAAAHTSGCAWPTTCPMRGTGAMSQE